MRNAETVDSAVAVDQSAKDNNGFLKRAKLESGEGAGVEDQKRSARPEPTVIPEAHFRKEPRRGLLVLGIEAWIWDRDEEDEGAD